MKSAIIALVVIVILAALVLVANNYTPKQKIVESKAAIANETKAAGQASDFPTSDVVGKDIANVPRYDGAIRISYLEKNDSVFLFQNITYYLKGDKVDDVENFYKKNIKLESAGTIIGIPVSLPYFGNITCNKCIRLNFQDSSTDRVNKMIVSVEVASTSYNGNEYTIIEVNSRKRLSDNIYYRVGDIFYPILSTKPNIANVSELGERKPLSPRFLQSYGIKGTHPETIDTLMRPILFSVFGGAKVTGVDIYMPPKSVGYSCAGLRFIVKRNITDEDIESVKNMLENKGYHYLNSSETKVGKDTQVSVDFTNSLRVLFRAIVYPFNKKIYVEKQLIIIYNTSDCVKNY